MKKIVSRQMPNTKIARPLLVAGVLLSLTAEAAEAQNDTAQRYLDMQRQKSTTQKLIEAGERAATRSPGCVMGAFPYSGSGRSGGSGATSKKNCRPVGCVVRCDQMLDG
jgi:hypothetical protein